MYTYSLPLKMEASCPADFCDTTDGPRTLTSPQGFTWIQGAQKAILDHDVAWNMAISSPKLEYLRKSHKRYDHGRISFRLPVEDFLKQLTPARDFTFLADKVNVIHFHSNLLEWHKRVADRISPFTPGKEFAVDGEPLIKQLLADQEMMKEEALALQFKEAKVRQRAKERLPGCSKEQTKVRRHHGIFAAAYCNAVRQ